MSGETRLPAGSGPRILALSLTLFVALAGDCREWVECPPPPGIPTFTVAVAVSQSQLEGWSAAPDVQDTSWLPLTCAYRAADDTYLRVHGSYIHVPPGGPLWGLYGTRSGPWGHFAERVVKERRQYLRLLAGAVGGSRLVWDAHTPPRWRPGETFWQVRYEQQIAESGWDPDITIFHLGDSDHLTALGQQVSAADAYTGMLIGMWYAIDAAYELTGAPVMVVPKSLAYCKGSWPACDSVPDPVAQAIHDAQIAAAEAHPQACVGPLVDDLRYEPDEPFTWAETHYHEVGELGNRIFDALADCGV